MITDVRIENYDGYTIRGIAEYAIARHRQAADLYDDAARRGNSDDMAWARSRMIAYGDVLNLITGHRNIEAAAEIVRSIR